MIPHKLIPLAALALSVAGCGGNGDTDDTDPVAGACAFAGTTDACVVYESPECTPDASYSALEGAWYEIRPDGSMMIQLAPNDAGLQMGFEILDASAIASAVEYSLPTEVILHFDDGAGTEYQACSGKLTITNYTADGPLWAKWSYKAKSVTGVCGEVDYYTSGGSFTNAEPCE